MFLLNLLEYLFEKQDKIIKPTFRIMEVTSFYVVDISISLTIFYLKYSFDRRIIITSKYLHTPLSIFDYFNVIFNAPLLNLLVYKEEEKDAEKLVKLLGMIFFFFELNCLVI